MTSISQLVPNTHSLCYHPQHLAAYLLDDPPPPSSVAGCTCPLQDILIQGEGGAQILVEPDLAEHFEAALVQVRTVPVETRLIPLSQLRVAPPRKMAINSIEASLRLDAVASAGETGGRQQHGLAVQLRLGLARP